MLSMEVLKVQMNLLVKLIQLQKLIEINHLDLQTSLLFQVLFYEVDASEFRVVNSVVFCVIKNVIYYYSNGL